ncbi:NACHT domain-containing protein [Amycolatopsis sp. NPDC051758]|uniref:NACHT domain-containing protein n=1 Tax=Amycolatopsis sp. NPDC051758 TaxID=3363935 RepID=UPI0037A6A951
MGTHENETDHSDADEETAARRHESEGASVTNNEAPKRARAVFIGLAAVAPPIMTLFLGSGANRLTTIIFVILYELLLLILGFFGAVYQNLQKRWVTRVAEQIDDFIQRRTSKFARGLREHVSSTHSFMDTRGLSTVGDYSFTLKQVFVDLKLNSSTAHSMRINPVQHPAESTTQASDIWTWVRRANEEKVPLAIVGPPGSGKTTLLKHVAQSLASRKRSKDRLPKYPIVLELRDLKKEFSGNKPDLPRLIRTTFSTIPISEPPNWLENALHQGEVCLILDGLDELGSAIARRAVIDWVEHQRIRYPKIVILVSSRPFGYKENPLPFAIVLQVEPFTGLQLEQFLKRWYLATCIRRHGHEDDVVREIARQGADDLLARLKRKPALRELTTNPLLLTMVANVHEYRGALPGSRVELYREVCEVFLGKRHKARGVDSGLDGPKRQIVLQELAYQMMNEHTRDISLATAEDIIGDVVSRVSADPSVSRFLQQIEDASGLVIERESGVYSFCHQTFQEYLAAVQVKENPANSGGGDLLANMCNSLTDPWWSEVIRLYSAQADATPILDSIAKLSKLDSNGILLAMDCLSEAREVRPEVRERVFALLDSQEMRSDPGARRALALASIEATFRDAISIDDGTLLSTRPVTCLQYQAYLDSTDTQPPDHWTERVFPLGFANLPISGMTSNDCTEFAKWATNALDDSWRYYIPTARQLDRHRFDLALGSPGDNSALNTLYSTNEKGQTESTPTNLDFDVSLITKEMIRNQIEFDTTDVADRIVRYPELYEVEYELTSKRNTALLRSAFEISDSINVEDELRAGLLLEGFEETAAQVLSEPTPKTRETLARIIDNLVTNHAASHRIPVKNRNDINDSVQWPLLRSLLIGAINVGFFRSDVDTKTKINGREIAHMCCIGALHRDEAPRHSIQQIYSYLLAIEIRRKEVVFADEGFILVRTH